MRLLRKLIIGLVVVIAVLALGSLLLPRITTVERSIAITAAPSDVFPYVNSMQRTVEWSPWLERDPNVQNTFSGPESGVGNKMEWTSDEPSVGSGVQVITESVQDEKVETFLDFGSQGTAVAQFLLAAEGDATQVTWTLESDAGYNPMARIFGLFLDGLVGADYEKGLSNLKSVVEG